MSPHEPVDFFLILVFYPAEIKPVEVKALDLSMPGHPDLDLLDGTVTGQNKAQFQECIRRQLGR